MPFIPSDVVDGWYLRSWLLRIVTTVLLLSISLLFVAIVCPYWATVQSSDGDVKTIGVFGYLFTADIRAQDDALPLLYVVLAVISFVVLLCDVILDLMFVTKNFHLVVPTVIVFSFIAGCMTATISILWGLAHCTYYSSLDWAYYLAALSAVLDFTASFLCGVEFLRFRRQFGRPIDRDVQRATEALEAEEGDARVAGEAGESVELRLLTPEQRAQREAPTLNQSLPNDTDPNTETTESAALVPGRASSNEMPQGKLIKESTQQKERSVSKQGSSTSPSQSEERKLNTSSQGASHRKVHRQVKDQPDSPREVQVAIKLKIRVTDGSPGEIQTYKRTVSVTT